MKKILWAMILVQIASAAEERIEVSSKYFVLEPTKVEAEKLPKVIQGVAGRHGAAVISAVLGQVVYRAPANWGRTQYIKHRYPQRLENGKYYEHQRNLFLKIEMIGALHVSDSDGKERILRRWSICRRSNGDWIKSERKEHIGLDVRKHPFDGESIEFAGTDRIYNFSAGVARDVSAVTDRFTVDVTLDASFDGGWSGSNVRYDRYTAQLRPVRVYGNYPEVYAERVHPTRNFDEYFDEWLMGNWLESKRNAYDYVKDVRCGGKDYFSSEYVEPEEFRDLMQRFAPVARSVLKG